jgi:hypothetical protein
MLYGVVQLRNALNEDLQTSRVEAAAALEVGIRAMIAVQPVTESAVVDAWE